MKIGNLVEKGKSAYQSSKDFIENSYQTIEGIIKNPRAYFVAPLAFAASI